MLLPRFSASAQSVFLNQEPAVFEHAPRLVKLSANLSQTRASGAKHRVTIAVPQNAGALLKAITITQPVLACFYAIVVSHSMAQDE